MIAGIRKLIRFSLDYIGNNEFRQYVDNAPHFAHSHRWAVHTTNDLPKGDTQPLDQSGALFAFFEQRSEGRGIHKWLQYFDAYERHLKRFVGQKVALAEIGIFSGGSLEMWQSYFGAELSLYGIDIAPETKIYENEQTKIFIGDQSDPTFWNKFNFEAGALDILIDDGSHDPAHQIFTFEEMFPRLKPGGVFICEDVHFEFNPFMAYVSGLLDRLNAYNPSPLNGDYQHGIESPASSLQSWIASVHVYPYLIVIEKRKTQLSTLQAPRHGSAWQAYYN